MATKRLPMRKIRDALRLVARGLSKREIAASLKAVKHFLDGSGKHFGCVMDVLAPLLVEELTAPQVKIIRLNVLSFHLSQSAFFSLA